MSDLIGPEEAGLIQAALSEINSEPPPTDSGPYGCMLALVALVGLVALPIVAARVGPHRYPAHRRHRLSAGFDTGRIGLEHVRRSVQPGQSDQCSRSGCHRADRASPGRAHGPHVSARYSHHRQRPHQHRAVHLNRLQSRGDGRTPGPALPYVVRVERWLVAHKGVYPVFTMSDDAEDEGD